MVLLHPIHTMAEIVLGIFSDRISADQAVNDLQNAGYGTRDISIITQDVRETDENGGGETVKGALSGATTGGIIGGVAGLLVGVGVIAIPEMGTFLAGGPIVAILGLTGAAATTVSGALTGVVVGGLVGGLASLGVSVEETRVYEERIREGAVLIAVPLEGKDEDRILEILEDHGADQTRVVSGIS